MDAEASRSTLVVGAGPTGLALALWMARAGVRPRIVAESSGPAQASRAMGVQARTLELYQQLGLGDAVVAGGLRVDTVHIRADGAPAARVALGDMGAGLSPYPFLLSYPQDDHERFLLGALAEAGVDVEWDTECIGLEPTAEGVHVRLRSGGAETQARAAYVCGCDGAGSAVRQALGVGFSGGTYEQRFFVADVLVGAADLDAATGVTFEGDAFVLLFPLRDRMHARLIGVLPLDLSDRDDLTFEDLRPTAERLTGLSFGAVNWFSVYRVHHRVADRFRAGRVFLAGDAGHVHSPVGGQGMNTGIGDAVNLGWKLAAVLRDGVSPELLDTYEPERIGFARTLVSTTDRLFSLIVGGGPLGHAARDAILPHVLARAMRFQRVRRALFRRISQIGIRYPDSALSVGAAGELSGGDRLPWVPEADNFAPLASRRWQAHVYGSAEASVREALHRADLPLHSFAWTDDAAGGGLRRDALYLVRPDGYVGLADPAPDPARIAAYVARFVAPNGG